MLGAVSPIPASSSLRCSAGGTQRFIPDNHEIFASREFTEPVVHRPDDGADSEFFVPQEITHTFLLESRRSAWIAPGHLHIERNETIARIPHEQNDLRPIKLLFRDKVFAADSVPKIAFRSVLE